MSKTNFVNNSTVVLAEFLNSIYLDGHDHKGENRDGSAPKITLSEIDDQFLNILNDLIAVLPSIKLLFKGETPKVPLFGGLGRDGAFTGTSNLDRSYYEFTSFVISSGQTVRCTGGLTRIKVMGDLTIGGFLQGLPINPFGIGKGWYNNGGNAYGLGASFIGSGGSEAVDHSDLAGLNTVRDRGGLGGSSIILEVLGRVTINGSIGCTGGNGSLSQILTGSPSIGGSGGGSGGSIIIQSMDAIQINGTLGVTGGNGANGQGSNSSGGGAGAGGWIVLMAPQINELPNALNVDSGVPGSSLGTGSRLGGGGGGFAGRGGNSKATGEVGKIIRVTQPVFTPI
ncbi:hypothetical protein HC928_02885 [bacterium]|nr:hypothetical protein [bacterium]